MPMLGVAQQRCGHAAKPSPEEPAVSVRGASSAAREEGGRVSRLPTGTWGGRGVVLQVTADGASVEYDCAHGTIEGRIELDADGRFDVTGTFVPEGGPVSVPADGVAKENTIKARYVGRVEGKKMSLNVTFPETGGGPGTLTLTHGQEPHLEKCY